MLYPPEITFWEPKLELPEVPAFANGKIDEYGVIMGAVQFDNKVVPNASSTVYTAAYAESHGGKGSCYAHAEVAATVLDKWRISDNYIIQDGKHASNLTTVRGNPRAFDRSGTLGLTHATGAAQTESNDVQLCKAYAELIKRGRETPGPIAEYFWFDNDGKLQSAIPEGDINMDLQIEEGSTAKHIVISAPKGIEMLHAFGDLRRFIGRGMLSRYKAEYPQLINLVSAFRAGDLPKPTDV